VLKGTGAPLPVCQGRCQGERPPPLELLAICTSPSCKRGLNRAAGTVVQRSIALALSKEARAVPRRRWHPPSPCR
jgi:hypothetical protein